MMKKPTEREFVVCKITKVNPNSAYAEMLEYKKEGMIHISEIARGWVKDIRSYIKPGQIVVAKIIGTQDGIKLSVKRVDPTQEKMKLKEYKLGLKAERMFEIAAKQADGEFKGKVAKGNVASETSSSDDNSSSDNLAGDSFSANKSRESPKGDGRGESPEGDVSPVAGDISPDAKAMKEKLEEEFGSLYEAFRMASKNPDILKEKGITGRWLEEIRAVAEKNIGHKEFVLKAELSIKSYKPGGINIIKKALEELERNRIRVRYISSPKYIATMKTKNVKADKKIFEELMHKAIKDPDIEGDYEIK